MYKDNTIKIKQTKDFIQEIKKILSFMTSQEKDEWIIRQAMLIEEDLQSDFLKSLSGEKFILNMPERKRIDEFCRQVNDGEICLEYEKHYCEFDESGRYMDDWVVNYKDPGQAMPFMDTVFEGCHKLSTLGEYEQVDQILGEICRLKFCVIEAEDSEVKMPDDEAFSIAQAFQRRMLCSNRAEVVYEWLSAFCKVRKRIDKKELARQLIDIFMLPLCEVMLPGDISDNLENSSKVYNEMIMLLEQIRKTDSDKMQDNCIKQYGNEWFRLRERMKREEALLSNLKAVVEEGQHANVQNSVLKASWKQIKESIKWLGYEQYIDDQPEIDEIYNICEALVRHLKECVEPWNIRRQVLQDIVQNDNYDIYNCYDPMQDLLNALCDTEEEYLQKADIMMKSSNRGFREQAAEIYYQYGYDEKYLAYLEQDAFKSEAIYLKLIEYYDSHNNKAKAMEVAYEALTKCRGNQTTEVFIFLIKSLYDMGNKDEATKQYRRAKQRKNVDIVRLEKALEV